ncbi:solute carrier family 35 member G1-like [Ornithodoros turicata]|uniref:solute carrier family 35 member G1-like n=1 Tax=Ornithodoros turicata TaxID=34597 RepID=UPI00313945F6
MAFDQRSAFVLNSPPSTPPGAVKSQRSLRSVILSQDNDPLSECSSCAMTPSTGLTTPELNAKYTESAIVLFQTHINFLTGMLYALLNSVVVGVISIFIKVLYDIPTGQLVCMRLSGILFFSLPLVICSRQHPFGTRHNRAVLVLRAVAGSAGLYFRFWSMKLIPLSDVAVILASLPVFVTALARVFLKEPCGASDTIILILTMIGLVMTTQVPVPLVNVPGSSVPSSDKFKGVTFSLLATLFSAIKFLMSRYVHEEHYSVTLFVYGLVGVMLCVIMAFCGQPYVLPRCGLGRVLFIVFIVLSFLEHMVLIKALQMENAGPVSVVIAATDVMLMFVAELLIFGNVPDKYSFGGAMIVSLCVVVSLAKKAVSESKQGSWVKRYLNWLNY